MSSTQGRDVVVEVTLLNDLLKAMGFDFRFSFGQGRSGTQHRLYLNDAPDGEKIGVTIPYARAFVQGMRHAFAVLRAEEKARVEAEAKAAREALPKGLCSKKTDHEPHESDGYLGKFWCHADQTQREPYRSERLRQASQGGPIHDPDARSVTRSQQDQ